MYGPYKRFCRLFLFCCSLFFLGTLEDARLNGAQAQETLPQTLVSDFHGVLLGVMKDADTVAVTGRYKRLEQIITESFHLRLMIQVATASYWRKATDRKKDLLTEAFSRLTIATYAAQFDGYSGQSFETRSAKPGPQKTTLIETHLLNPGGQAVELVYVTRKFNGKWRIIDVLLDTGISELARKRSEYRQILKTGGIDHLIRTMSGKTQMLLQG